MQRRIPVLAILGAARPTGAEETAARRAGELAARCGWAVLTGGGGGVMAAASRGAMEAGGLTIGVLPGTAPEGEYPNPWVKIPIYTGLGSARNVVNVLSGTLCLAIGGQTGTLSEVAHAVKAGREVWWLWPWRLDPPNGHPVPTLRPFHDVEELIAALEDRLSSDLPGNPSVT